MNSIACLTLGCKVNQYDTQAMREAFERAGYQSVPFDGPADVYLINTCTVTGTGDQKSLKLIRRIAKKRPESAIIVAGCLAQRDAERVMLPGVRLVLGTKDRARVVELFERAVGENTLICAVGAEAEWTFERLTVTRHEGRTRAVMKIQEGCDNRCAYCVIPSVRGPVRSMPLDQLAAEARALGEAGYKELVLTGIHLMSYGRDMGLSLMDALQSAHDAPGIERIRLGSLEPVGITEEFVRALTRLPKVCPQFHLSMQSGSDSVLRRMRRHYNTEQYLQAASRLKSAFGGCALTTDVIAGFPGETDQEHRQTMAFIERIGFARIHVFPFSPRTGTEAASMPEQVPEQIKKARAAEMIALGTRLEEDFVKSLVGTVQRVLFEAEGPGGLCEGYTQNYVRVLAQGRVGDAAEVMIRSAQGTTALGAQPPGEGRTARICADPAPDAGGGALVE
jgi:threonylcarbamoyladenosine tRNA methylthiotransferase MtaB